MSRRAWTRQPQTEGSPIDKTNVMKSLAYWEEGKETQKLDLRQIRRTEGGSEDEQAACELIVNVLSRTRWATAKHEEGDKSNTGNRGDDEPAVSGFV